jgi:hypothetical protein
MNESASAACPVRVVAADWSALRGFGASVEELGRANEGEGRVPADLAILLIAARDRPLQGLAGFVDWRSDGALSRLISRRAFTGKRGEKLLRPAEKVLPFERIVLFGVGEVDEWAEGEAAKIAQDVVACARGLRSRAVALAWVDDPSRIDAWGSCFEALLRALDPPAGGAEFASEGQCPEPGVSAVEEVDQLDVELVESDGPGQAGRADSDSMPHPVSDDGGPEGFEERAVRDEQTSADVGLSGEFPADAQGPREPAASEGAGGEDAPSAALEGEDDMLSREGGEQRGGSPADTQRWWIVAPEALCTRLRGRILGTPRAADGG